MELNLEKGKKPRIKGEGISVLPRHGIIYKVVSLDKRTDWITVDFELGKSNAKIHSMLISTRKNYAILFPYFLGIDLLKNMYQQDYILRMIERIGILIAGILVMIKKKDFPGASESINDAYLEVLKEDAAFFNGIPLTELTENLVQQHHYTNGHLQILSELFYAQAELSYARKDLSSSLLYYQKSLILLEFFTKASSSYSLEKQARISHINDRIADLKFSDATTGRSNGPFPPPYTDNAP